VKRVFFLSTLVAAGLALLLLSGCGKKEAEQQSQRPPSAVTATKALAKDVPIYLDEIGRCAAPEVVSVQPQVGGRITEIFFKDGAELKKGDRLFTIDPRPFQAVLEQAKADLALNQASLEQADAALKQNQAQLEESQAQLEQAKYRQSLNETEFTRAKSLLETNAVSKQEYDKVQMAATVGEAQVRAATATVEVARAQGRQSTAAIAMVKARIAASEAAIKTAEINLDYSTINSPIDGRAGQRLMDVGNVVATMNAPSLVVIQRLDPLYTDFTIPESELANVRASMAQGQLKVLCRIPETSDTREGDVSFLDNAVQDGTGTIKMRAIIPNQDRRFWPGQFVNVRLILGTKQKAILVPLVATQIAQSGPFVYVVKPDSTADLRPVKMGQRHDDMIVIDSGVSAGEDVVITGQLMLYPTAKVSVKSPAEGPPPSADAKPESKPEATEASPEKPDKNGGAAKQ
jgi:multidrug efflux system membrane fusion protein